LIRPWTLISRPSFSLSSRIPHRAKKWTTCIPSVCACVRVDVAWRTIEWDVEGKGTRSALCYHSPVSFVQV
jgi:hypothetical protein